MAFIHINPVYQAFLTKYRLTSAEHFLELPVVIVSGHPDRNVARLTIGGDSESIRAFLKREHRIPWRDRVRNARDGFGFVSKSHREAVLLNQLRQSGIGCPDWLAVGEDDRGQAFLLVREIAGAVDLRLFLHERACAPARRRRRFAMRLGQSIAHIHNAGFDHPDLYSKHILVHPTDGTIYFLDWQRSRRRRFVGWARRWRDLAALDATLADDLVGAEERKTCLRAYLRECRKRAPNRQAALLPAAFHIFRTTKRLLRRPRIQEMRGLPLGLDTQNLIWLDGEALCMTPEFHRRLQGEIPAALRLDNLPAWLSGPALRCWLPLPEGRRGILVRRRRTSVVATVRAWLRGRPSSSPELRRAAELFRLERQGTATPRLLAFGQRYVFPAQVESFLLTESVSD